MTTGVFGYLFPIAPGNPSEIDEVREFISLALQYQIFPNGPNDPSAYAQLISFIENVRDLCLHRCTDYEYHADFLDSWLYAIQNNPNVTTGEIYEVGLWAKSLREEIQARHLLQFGIDALVVLEIASWEFDLFVMKRFFNAVPIAQRTFSMERLLARVSAPIPSLHVFRHAQRFGVNSYDELVLIFKEMNWSRSARNIQFHHLIEQRFAHIPEVIQWQGNASTGKWKSIVLTLEEHQQFTNQWRYWIPKSNQAAGPLGVNTTTAQLSHVQDAARQIYANYPEILQALGLL